MVESEVSDLMVLQWVVRVREALSSCKIGKSNSKWLFRKLMKKGRRTMTTRGIVKSLMMKLMTLCTRMTIDDPSQRLVKILSYWKTGIVQWILASSKKLNRSGREDLLKKIKGMTRLVLQIIWYPKPAWHHLAHIMQQLQLMTKAPIKTWVN